MESRLDLSRSSQSEEDHFTFASFGICGDVEVETVNRFLNMDVNIPNGSTLDGTDEGFVGQFRKNLRDNDKRLLADADRRRNPGG